MVSELVSHDCGGLGLLIARKCALRGRCPRAEASFRDYTGIQGAQNRSQVRVAMHMFGQWQAAPRSERQTMHRFSALALVLL